MAANPFPEDPSPLIHFAMNGPYVCGVWQVVCRRRKSEQKLKWMIYSSTFFIDNSGQKE
jgi:hypothetical protein